MKYNYENNCNFYENEVEYGLGWPKSPLGFFPYDGSSNAQLFLTSFKTILLDYVVTAVLSACIKKTAKLVNFCAAILIMKMEENTRHFWHVMLYYFKKGKSGSEMPKKDLHTVWRRCCD